MIKVELTEQQWIAALNAMSLAPYREIQPLIEAITKQIMAQKQATAEPAAA
jgi:hypothetical protein